MGAGREGEVANCVGLEILLGAVDVYFDKVQVTEPGFALDSISPEVSWTLESGINGSDRLILGTRNVRRNGVVFLNGLGRPSWAPHDG